MNHRSNGERGAAIVTAVLLILVIAGLCYAFLTNTAVLNQEHHARTGETRVLYVAEAGANVGAVEILPTLALGESRTVGAPDDLIEFGGGGYWLDGWLGTRPWFAFIGFFVGLAAGVLNVYRVMVATGAGNSSKPTGREGP